MSTIKCSKCKHENIADYLNCYCGSCGERLTSPPRSKTKLKETCTETLITRPDLMVKSLVCGFISWFIAVRFIWLFHNRVNWRSSTRLELLLIVLGPVVGIIGIWLASKANIKGVTSICVKVSVVIAAIVNGLIFIVMFGFILLHVLLRIL
ncbi:MAG: hypothetical protein FWC73_01955 [Defluviitaleaceae bacterium]|nr:hypothetical protein [Defluviitaleaceae bacterium]